MILAVFFAIRGRLHKARKFPLLPYWYKAGAESKGKAWAEEKASGFEADDDVWSMLRPVDVVNVEFECCDEGFV